MWFVHYGRSIIVIQDVYIRGSWMWALWKLLLQKLVWNKKFKSSFYFIWCRSVVIQIMEGLSWFHFSLLSWYCYGVFKFSQFIVLYFCLGWTILFKISYILYKTVFLHLLISRYLSWLSFSINKNLKKIIILMANINEESYRIHTSTLIVLILPYVYHICV